MSRNGYLVCEICSKTVYGNKVNWHMNKFHSLSYEEYYLAYVDPQAVTHCPVCSEKLPFYWGRYPTYCSHSCNGKVNASELHKKNPLLASRTLRNTIEKYPGFQSKAGRLGGISTHVKHPSLASINGSRNMKELNKFKKNHEGLTPTEFLLWKNSDFQKLNPIKQDRRFMVGNKGIVMDFSLPNYKLNIELDNLLPGLLQHNSEEDKQRDLKIKEQYGWRVVRFSNFEVKQDVSTVVQKIIRVLRLYERSFI